jgi:hypothetical protein
MSLPDQTSKLPKLPFLIGDVVLLATAWFIANRGPGPLTADAIAAIFGCVAVGAVLLAVPFISDYARRQDEVLDERQRGLDALSRTINTAAEQISIAANGLHQITEITHKNLKHAEQLPQRLQEKIAEFNAQVENTREDEREELEKEIAELRASESERLETIAGRIHQATAELAKLEAAVQKQIAARAGAVEQSESALAKAHRDIATKLEKALADFDTKLAERAAAVIAAIESAAPAATSRAAPAQEPAAAPVAVTPDAAAEPAPQPVETANAPEVAAPPKRPRKSRREEPATADAQATPASNAVEPAVPPAAPVETAAPAESPAEPVVSVAEPAAEVEPPPVPAGEMVKIEPVAPRSAVPFSAEAAAEAPAAPAAVETAPAEAVAASAPASPPVEAPAERAAKKRAPRKPAAAPADEGELELALPTMDDAPVTQADAVERVISSDGATRLIATAYIGIGNRLFIRGEGPGLSWEKGVPLQFVSIGKWRWETVDAVAPIAFKLLKNDEVECTALGTLTLEPGHQQEVTAKF